MADPLLQLERAFRKAIPTAFGDAYADVDPMLRPSDRADYQANFAMGLAKRLGAKNPREVAAAVVTALAADDLVASTSVAGPGFVNITLRDEHVAKELTALSADPTLGLAAAVQGEVVVVDYSAPNVAKDMHVGHLRSTIIGDSLVRVFERLGFRVVRQNHIGDWGTPFGMLIEHLLDSRLSDEDLPIERLNALYKESRVRFDSDADFAERARRRVVLLQGGDADTRAAWQRLIDLSKKHFTQIYRRLGVTLTEADIAGESSYNDALGEVIDELAAQGLVRESDGAACVFPPGFEGREGDPLPLILRKQDGGYGYATTDVTAIRHRIRTLGAQRIVYVIGATQSQHLAMVFAVAKMAGWLAAPVRAEHVAFGSVLGADKKLLRTRSGEATRLIDLLEESEQRAAEAIKDKFPDLTAEERSQIAHAVGIGAIKYADLSNDRIKDYVFDWDRMLAFQGNTAPYLMYAHARVRSIFRKAGEQQLAQRSVQLTHPAERALALALLGFPSAVAQVASTLQPHLLCSYLYPVAVRFAEFFEQCPVLRASTEAERTTRLALSDVAARTLAAGLDLLGIEAPERM